MRSARHARDTREVVTYLYGVMQDMQDTYDSGATVTKVALHPKMMKLQKKDNSSAFLALKTPRVYQTSTDTCTTNSAPESHRQRNIPLSTEAPFLGLHSPYLLVCDPRKLGERGERGERGKRFQKHGRKQ